MQGVEVESLPNDLKVYKLIPDNHETNKICF
jgi:hypothetical protein